MILLGNAGMIVNWLMPLFELAQIKTADTTLIIIRVPLHYYLNQIIKKSFLQERRMTERGIFFFEMLVIFMPLSESYSDI